ncbi:MAG: MucB/RseB C-terminal domain-containing protein, partial [Thiotrichaceae bacterium]|nr:MucB/RseB C-terminal domain-containing protein [Thiotrichaceae bacterium]
SASKKINNFSLGRIPKVTPALQKIYSFDLGAKSKVAGRSCQIVLARPKDRKRYLQKYCIDAKHSIVLKYTLIDQKHKTVEQFMFTSFKVLSANKKSQNIMAQISKSLIPVKAMTKGRKSNKEASWIFDSLPTGFKPISNHWVKNDKFNRKSKQLIVSDGMTSVSVFISKGTSKNGEPISSGALNIVSHKLLAYEVVLVGEVPKATLEDIFKALRKL